MHCLSVEKKSPVFQLIKGPRLSGQTKGKQNEDESECVRARARARA